MLSQLFKGIFLNTYFTKEGCIKVSISHLCYTGKKIFLFSVGDRLVLKESKLKMAALEIEGSTSFPSYFRKCGYLKEVSLVDQSNIFIYLDLSLLL